MVRTPVIIVSKAFEKFRTEAFGKSIIDLAHKLIASRYRLRRSRLRVRYALDVTRSAHEPTVEWVAPFIRLVGQLHTAILANVTVHVKVFVHGNHSDRLLGSLMKNEIFIRNSAAASIAR